MCVSTERLPGLDQPLFTGVQELNTQRRHDFTARPVSQVVKCSPVSPTVRNIPIKPLL